MNMKTSKIIYLGELRTKMIHNKSSSTVITDAPTDNRGKGAAFSPTDLVASALGSCMLTIMGIKARDQNINIEGSYVEVQKSMKSAPRAISKIELYFYMQCTKKLSQGEKRQLEAVALACPVAKSIHPEVIQSTSFFWK